MSDKFERANALIRRFSYWSAGFGLIPLPLIDVAVITGTQIKMVRDLTRIYDQEFSDERTRSAIGALVGSIVPVALGSGTASALKMVPVVGQIAGVLLVPALAAASTVAVGRVFVQHFETGGTLLDFDPDHMRAHFYREFEAARGGSPRAESTVVPRPPAPAAKPASGLV